MTNLERTAAIDEYLRTHEAKKERQPIKDRTWGLRGLSPERFQRVIKRNREEAAARSRAYRERSLRREQPNV